MSLQRLAFDLVIAKLDSQRVDLTNLRAQARTSATITGLIGALFAGFVGSDIFSTSFFGDAFLGLSLTGALLIGFFVISITLACMVLVNWDEVTFSFETRSFISKRDSFESDEKFFAYYVQDGEWYFRSNERVINRIQWMLWWSTVLGWSQIVPWVILIVEASNV